MVIKNRHEDILVSMDFRHDQESTGREIFLASLFFPRNLRLFAICNERKRAKSLPDTV